MKKPWRIILGLIGFAIFLWIPLSHFFAQTPAPLASSKSNHDTNVFALIVTLSVVALGTGVALWQRHKARANHAALALRLGLQIPAETEAGIIPTLPALAGRHRGRQARICTTRDSAEMRRQQMEWRTKQMGNSSHADLLRKIHQGIEKILGLVELLCAGVGGDVERTMVAVTLTKPSSFVLRTHPNTNLTATLLALTDLAERRSTIRSGNHGAADKEIFGAALETMQNDDDNFDDAFIIKTNDPTLAKFLLSSQIRHRMLEANKQKLILPELRIEQGEVRYSERGNLRNQRRVDNFVEWMDLTSDLAEQMENHPATLSSHCSSSNATN